MATVTLAPAGTAGHTSLVARLSRLAALGLSGPITGSTSVVADIAGDTHVRLDPIIGSTSVAIAEPVAEWQPFPLTPSGIGFESAVAGHGDLLVIVGGYLDSGGRTTHCYVYDTKTDGPWTAIADLPVATGDGTLLSLGSRVYLFGGDIGGKATTSYFYDFDNAAAGWQAGPALPMAAYAPVACVVGGLVYIGFWGTYAGDSVMSMRFFSIDPTAASPTFTRLADMPTYRQWALTVEWGGVIYVVSGDANDYDSTTNSVPVLQYDIAANAWSTAPMPSTTGYSWIAGGGLSGDTIYLLQADTGDASRFVSYTLGSGQSSWTTLPNGPFTQDTATDINSAIVDSTLYAATNDYRGTPPDSLYRYALPRPRTPALRPTALRGVTVTTATLSRWRSLSLEPIVGRGWGTARLERAGVLTPDPIVGAGIMRAAGGQYLATDRIIAATELAAPLAVTGPVTLGPAGIIGATQVAVTFVPDFDVAEPVLLDWVAAATLAADDNRPPLANVTPGVTRNLAMPGIVLTTPAPAVADGQPTLPRYWARFAATATPRQGPGHIRAIEDPDPKWDPRFDGWSVPPPEAATVGVGDYRWTVATLPDPAGFPDGWYWLGEPSVRDSTSGIAAGARQWAADPATGGPAWQSFFPFKPSVSAVSAAVPGERDPVHYSRVLHLSTHYVEHMWLDFGKNMPQPFTWLVVAMVTSDPSAGYLHTILDAGRNPDTVGFPRISADDTSTDRRIADGLPYRMQLAATRSAIQMATSVTGLSVGLGSGAGYRPRMYTGVFNGTKSLLSAWDKAGRHAAAGAIGTGSSYTHRYAVLGRQQGWISQDHAANLMVFEIRYWARALTVDELEAQYAQISSTYKFSQYG